MNFPLANVRDPEYNQAMTNTPAPTRCRALVSSDGNQTFGRCMLNAGHDEPCYRGEITEAVMAAVNARDIRPRDTSVAALAETRRLFRSNEAIA